MTKGSAEAFPMPTTIIHESRRAREDEDGGASERESSYSCSTIGFHLAFGGFTTNVLVLLLDVHSCHAF